MNDFCHFRIELDVGKSDDPVDMFMEVELMFFDCMNNNASSKANATSKEKEKEKEKEKPKEKESGQAKSTEECCLFNESKSLATLKFKFIDTVDGIHEFVPVLFEDSNFCVANVILHTIRLGGHCFYLSNLLMNYFVSQITDSE